MTTVVGGHFMVTAPLPPRSGILLNASPSNSAPNSPKRTYYLSSGLLGGAASGTHPAPASSHSSASSSTSSTDDIVSSTSATSTAGTQASSSSATAHNPPRKIRFAPLPEPRRDYDYPDEDLLSPGFFPGFDSAASSPNYPTQALFSPPVSPNVRPTTPTRSPNLNASHAQASCSTLGLSLDGVELPDSGQATETNTVAGSECGTDDTHTLSNTRKRTGWSRLLPFPKPATIKSDPRTPDEHGQISLYRSPSRESCASGYSFRGVGLRSLFGSLSDTNASSVSLGPLTRRKTHTGVDSTPVSPTMSFRSGLTLKPIVSEAGTSATSAPRGKGHLSTGSAPPAVRRGTRLLNGRVYGGRRPSSAGSKNPFANIRNTEPEFIEWGHGGMGSVQAAGLGLNRYVKLQSNNRLSVGHDDGGKPAGDDDDGSGMSWVRKRREQRERERREREEREAREKVEKEGATGEGEGEKKEDGVHVEAHGATGQGDLRRTPSKASKTEAALPSPKEVAGPVSPIDASEQKDLRDLRTSGDKQSADEKAEARERKEKEHIYATVPVPAPRPHYLHSRQNSRQNSLNSDLVTPQRSVPHTPTLLTPATEAPPHVIVTTSPLGTPGSSTAVLGPRPSPLGLGTSSPEDSSTPNSSASSSYEEEGPLGERDEDRDEGDEDDEEELNEQARKTAIGAGVEKISRYAHKD